jgi:hypothetical protein
MFVAAFVPFSSVVAPITQPHNIYGTGAEWGTDPGGPGPLTGSNEITGWIDGVKYGINTTEAGTPQEFDLYVDGDTWGVEPDNWFKDGGYEGDTIQYFINYDPTDYYLQISDYTSTYEPGAAEDVDLFFDTQTNTDLALGDTYLRGLKINEIVFTPWDYVYIYDPNGELNEAALEDAAKGYYLQVDDSVGHDPDGDIFDFNLYPDDVIAFGAPNYYYINVSKHATMDLSPDDELKLVWKNPGGGDNIANGTDVIVDRVEWGNHNNYFSGPDPLVQDYDNTTLSNIQGTPGLGWSFRLTTNGTDTDNPAGDFSVLPATPWPPVSGGGAMPGAPSNLRVHKSGTNDLLLDWDAPSINYPNLVSNIVYYDMDLSDGFQYTSYEVFPTTNPGAGNTDSATLSGYLADGNNYAFIVHTTGDATQGGPNENPTNTNVGYKYVETLLANALPQTSQKFISVPYFSDWTAASDISGSGTEFTDGSIISAVLKWNYATQLYDKRTWVGAPFNVWNDDFPINPGDSIAVGIITSSPYEWKIVGAYDDTLDFTFDANTAPLTSQMFTSIPYHSSYTMASDIAGPGKEFTDGSIITAILQWNYATQLYDKRTWVGAPFNVWSDDFTIESAPGGHLAFGIFTTSPYLWTPQVTGL